MASTAITDSSFRSALSGSGRYDTAEQGSRHAETRHLSEDDLFGRAAELSMLEQQLEQSI